MRFSVAQQSVKGSRSINQDRVGFAERNNAVLTVVADGLGGHEGGDLAAETLVDTFLRSFENIRHPSISDPAAYLVLTTVHAHTSIRERSQERGMDAISPRTTCVVCLIQNGLAYWAHVGDSRLYLFRNKRRLVRTRDHSTREELIREGLIKKHGSGYDSSQLTRCVGGVRTPKLTLGAETRLQAGDTILLCSDGVWRALRTKDLATHANVDQVEDGIESLLSHAQRAQPEDCDNLSAVLLRWQDPASSDKPLYNLSVPTLDQDNIWQTRNRPADPGAETKGLVKPKENLGNKLADIESFVNKIDDIM